MVKIPDHGEDHTPWATWEYRRGILNHFWKNLQNSEIGNWTGGRKYSGEGSISQPPKTRDEMRVSLISRNQGMSQLIQSTYGLEYYVVHKVSTRYKHWCNSWSTEPLLLLCSRTSKSLSLGGCWRPLFPILTVNFSGMNWALHYVSYIFYLILTNSTSFGVLRFFCRSMLRICKKQH